MSEIETIIDVAHFRSIAVAEAAQPGSIAVENVNGVMKQVTDQGVATNLGGAGAGILSWAQGRNARADFLLNTPVVQVTNPIPIDFLHTPGTAGSTNPPTLDPTFSGGVYKFPGPAFGTLFPFGAAVGVPTLIHLPKTEPWYVSGLFRFEAAAAASVSVPIRLIDATATDIIEVLFNQATDAHIAQLLYTNGTPTTKPLGAVATLGATTCPVGAFFSIDLWFDAGAGTLNVSFSDVLAGSFSGAALNNMPTVALGLEVLGEDSTLLMKCAGLFVKLASPT